MNSAGNFKACGLSTTQLSWPGTLAHELGHILGAKHVDDSSNLMYFQNSGNLFHKDNSNIIKISRNFGWREDD